MSACEDLFYKLLAGKFVPGIGLADTLEIASVPYFADITNAIRQRAAELPSSLRAQRTGARRMPIGRRLSRTR